MHRVQHNDKELKTSLNKPQVQYTCAQMLLSNKQIYKLITWNFTSQIFPVSANRLIR